MPSDAQTSVLDKVFSPATLAKLDAFPKVPSAYKARSESRGFMTLFVVLLGFLLVLNDFGEYLWGWPDHEFRVDDSTESYMHVNLDMVVAMPCGFLSVDLKDAMGDRLYLSNMFTRDGVEFDRGQASLLYSHSPAFSAPQVVSQSRKSRGWFSWFGKSKKNLFRPTYKHQSGSTACRIYGSVPVKRVMSNLHITAIGHGYATYEHVDHNQMNMSHVITEFSFGPYFPEIVQPLDNSYESTTENFISYQYFITVVPTTYVAPRTAPLETNQYSVSHYVREVDHDRQTPGIFFKFEIDPLHVTIHQRTTSFRQFITRVIGVIGGVFVCMGYAIRVTTKAVEVVVGSDNSSDLAAAESSSVKSGLRAKWAGGELRSRKGPSNGGWVVENNQAYAGYGGTPTSATFSPMSGAAGSPYLHSPAVLTGSGPGSPAIPSYAPPLSSRTASGGFPVSQLAPPRTPAYPSSPLPYPPSPSPYSPHPSAGFGTDVHGSAPGTPASAYGTYSNGYTNGQTTNGHTTNGNGYHPRSPALASAGLAPGSTPPLPPPGKKDD